MSEELEGFPILILLIPKLTAGECLTSLRRRQSKPPDIEDLVTYPVATKAMSYQRRDLYERKCGYLSSQVKRH